MSNLKKYEKKGYDLDFLRRVQPQGGENIRSHYIQGGDGFSTCLHVTGYPTKGLSNLWMKDILQQENVIGFQSTESFDSRLIEKAAKDSINEKESRLNPNANNTENNKESQEIMDLYDLVDDVTRQNETIKGISMRLWVYDITEEKLMDRVKKIRDQLSQFKIEIMLDELDVEFESIFTSPERQKNLLGGRPNRPIRSYDLAGGYFLDHVKLEDENGSYFGKTSTNGAVIFDFLKRDSKRTNSFMIVAGNPNMGQGTFVMAQLDHLFSEGHFIRNIKTDQKPYLNSYTGNNLGVWINMSGGDHRINPFQIFPICDENGSVNEIKSFRLHVAKLKNIFETLTPNATDTDARVFRSLVRNFYCQYPNENDPLWYVHPKRHEQDLKATKIPYQEYPKLSHFVAFVEGEKNRVTDLAVQQSLFTIKETFDELLQTQPDLFEGTTSENFKALSKEKLVTFDLSGLVGQPEYLNAQLFSVMSMLSYDVSENGRHNAQLMSKDHTLQPVDLNRLVINITNISQMVHPRYPSAAELLYELVEALAQNEAGIIIQAPNIQTMLSTNQENSRHTLAMHALFDLMNYRVFGQLGVTDKQLLEEVLKEEIGEYELDASTNFEQRQLYLGIHGQKGLIFTQDYSPEELGEYGGWY